MQSESTPSHSDDLPFQVFRSYIRLPPRPGGMERHIANLSEAQRRLGVSVVNIFNRGEPAGPAIPVLPAVDLSLFRPASLRNLLFYAFAARAARYVTPHIPTALHVHGDYSDIFFSKYLGQRLQAGVIAASLHGAVRENCPWLYRKALAHCALVFATGKREQLFLEGALGRRVYHFPSAPGDRFFEPPAAPSNKSVDVVAVANLFRNKRLDLLIECAAARPMYRFEVFGDGPEREPLTQLALKRGLSNITFRGLCSTEVVLGALHSSRVFVSLSESEGTPTAALEAMAVGLPVIITPSNLYAWLIEDGKHGFTTRSWAIEEILACIDRVVTNDALRQTMGAAAQQRALEESWEWKARWLNTLMGERLQAGPA